MKLFDAIAPYTFMPPFLAEWLPLLLLVIPPTIKHRSWRSFFLSLLWICLGIMLPATWFLLSCGLHPQWKSEELWTGTFTCFFIGKLWLSPLVLWALAAFYVRVIWKTAKPLQAWIVLGYWIGAIVSVICLIHGVIALGIVHGLVGLWRFMYLAWPFAVPVASAIYYTVVARRLLAAVDISMARLCGTFATTLPLWIASIWQSIKTYESLPEHPPTCFVVTAAMRGHSSIVGPFMTHSQSGINRLVNQQLLTFWAIEKNWSEHYPNGHALFRRIYNIAGPIIARCIRHIWVADAVYLALKPLEWSALLILRTTKKI